MLRKVSYCLMILFATQLLAQTNATINIKGVVTDELTGKPVGKEMEMIVVGKNNGKRFAVRVNSKTGEYLQPLASGDTYTITFSSYAVFKKVETLDIPSTSKYREETHNYTVRAIVEGNEMANVAAFEPGQSNLSAESQTAMESVRETMRQNRDLNIVVTVQQEEIPKPPPPPPAPKTKVAPKKQKGKKVAEPTPVETAPVETGPAPGSPNTQLYDARIAALKQYFSEVKNAELRIKIVSGSLVPGQAGQKNVRFTVGEVKSILD